MHFRVRPSSSGLGILLFGKTCLGAYCGPICWLGYKTSLLTGPRLARTLVQLSDLVGYLVSSTHALANALVQLSDSVTGLQQHMPWHGRWSNFLTRLLGCSNTCPGTGAGPTFWLNCWVWWDMPGHRRWSNFLTQLLGLTPDETTTLVQLSDSATGLDAWQD